MALSMGAITVNIYVSLDTQTDDSVAINWLLSTPTSRSPSVGLHYTRGVEFLLEPYLSCRLHLNLINRDSMLRSCFFCCCFSPA